MLAFTLPVAIRQTPRVKVESQPPGLELSRPGQILLCRFPGKLRRYVPTFPPSADWNPNTARCGTGAAELRRRCICGFGRRRIRNRRSSIRRDSFSHRSAERTASQRRARPCRRFPRARQSPPCSPRRSLVRRCSNCRTGCIESEAHL